MLWSPSQRREVGRVGHVPSSKISARLFFCRKILFIFASLNTRGVPARWAEITPWNLMRVMPP